MKIRRNQPEEGELVIVTVKNISPSSVFCHLDEYNVDGMIHVSEIASTWVKDIRKYAKVGQKLVVKIISLDRRGMISLSLKRVKPTQKREKISEIKNEKRGENFLKLIAKKTKKDVSQVYKEIGEDLENKFGTVYAGFEASVTGKDVLTKEGINTNWAEIIHEIAKKNIKPKEAIIKAKIKLYSFNPDGLKLIKIALDIKKEGVKIKYISAPNYSLEIKGKDFQKCEKVFKDIEEQLRDTVKKYNGEFEIIRSKVNK